jgi:hypothetical protein
VLGVIEKGGRGGKAGACWLLLIPPMPVLLLLPLATPALLCFTKTYTIAGLVLTAPPSLSITLRLKINVAVFSFGNRVALNVGVAVLEPDNVTGTPAALGN